MQKANADLVITHKFPKPTIMSIDLNHFVYKLTH